MLALSLAACAAYVRAPAGVRGDGSAAPKGDKAANEAAKITEKAYVAKCGGEAAKPAAAAPATAPVAPTAAAKPAPAATKKPTDGRQAEYARERACGADWKADKAANKVPAGMTWPKYWSECNKRKKAAGM